jgi:predicted molibdopterin-dependent oxidoreductase YjgC
MKWDKDILKPISWEEAQKIFATGVQRISGKDWGVYAGGRLTLEELIQTEAFVDKNMNGALKSSFSFDSMSVGKVVGETFGATGSPWSYGEVDQADMVLTVGFDDDDMATILGVKIRGAKAKGAAVYGVGLEEPDKAQFVFSEYSIADSMAATLAGFCKAVSDSKNKALFDEELDLDDYASDSILQAFKQAKKPVIVVSGKVGRAAAQWSANLAALKGCPVLALSLTPNEQGLLEMGFSDDVAARKGLLILGEDPVGCAMSEMEVEGIIGSAAFVVVADAFFTPTCERADLILPLKVSGERAGSFLSGEGRLNSFPKGLKADYPCLFDKIPEADATEKLDALAKKLAANDPSRAKGKPRRDDIEDSEIRYVNGADYLSAQVNWEFEQMGI